ncbi:GIY-YIG nuclease family protein [Pedobacter chitinilyticus]|uniref:GIY-YIG nuclease family protein n=1 Tax=Pedobacter chitinilyticus TaxID=2233776 RepID=A0A443YKS3_9SPHI|nr:GIY-YIG nuclease family protein [Pedobacter chitinilyticus]RWU04342.1 GIY-YIG nuclease family protein [Pedobacter chitinilyticus]
MFYLYILYSDNSDKYYIGYTNDYERRFHEHNHSDRTTFTSKHRPWILKVVFECGEIEIEAIHLERFIKKQKSRKLLERLIDGEALTGILAQLVRVPYVRD